MCIGIPAKVIKINGDMGKVDYQGVQRETSFMMLPEAKVGDYVLLHAGFAIKRLSEEDALETLELIREMLKAGEQTDER
ncbi:MAG: HypC/HybG/HupF family hydrogenase formation chaperone [candidate division WOR-3 bacterium]|nr:HypC/HybG/HupF family hydrogenase formation chaperone [candidate division WOR-3 bacterium]